MVIDYAVNRGFAPSVFGSCCDGALLVSPTLLTLVIGGVALVVLPCALLLFSLSQLAQLSFDYRCLPCHQSCVRLHGCMFPLYEQNLDMTCYKTRTLPPLEMTRIFNIDSITYALSPQCVNYTRFHVLQVSKKPCISCNMTGATTIATENPNNIFQRGKSYADKAWPQKPSALTKAGRTDR